jgi:hypothetical protein
MNPGYPRPNPDDPDPDVFPQNDPLNPLPEM